MYRGTIYPSAVFDDSAAAEALEKAMRGGKDDKERGVQLLLNANNAQRQMIRTPYKVRYGKDLEEELKKHLKGDMEEVILSLMNTPTKEDVVQLHRAVKGLGTNEKVLNEILASRNNDEIESIRNTYFTNYGKSLEEAVAADTSGDYKKMLISLVQGSRDRSQYPDGYKAQKDAEVLAKPLEKKFIGGSGDKFEKYRVLTMESFPQLRRTFEEYQRKTGNTLDKAIEKELSGDIGDLVSSLYNIAAFGHTRYFANRIVDSVKGRGTRDADLIRVLVSRSEVDLEEIKEEVARLYGKPLTEVIKEECKGAYKEALLSLVRGNKQYAL